MKLIARHIFTKSFKTSKNSVISSDIAQNGLVTPCTFSPLGAKYHLKKLPIFNICNNNDMAHGLKVGAQYQTILDFILPGKN
jgi:hypothetical protein